MPIKARPFETKISEVEIEGFIEKDTFVFRFYDLVEYRAVVLSFGEDARGQFAILQETEILDSDGFEFAVVQHHDADLGSEWGYQVSLKRHDTSDRDRLNILFKQKGLDPSSVNLIIPPRQLISVYFDPHGVQDGSAQLNSQEGQLLKIPKLA